MKPARAAIELKASICTDNPTGTDIYPFGAGKEAQHVANNGIERQGGLLPLYEQETTFADSPASYYVADDGTVIEVYAGGATDSGALVKLDGVTVGTVSKYGIEARSVISNVDDLFLSGDDTIVTMKHIYGGGTTGSVVLNEYDFTLTLLNTRTISLTAGVEVGSFRFFFVRYAGSTGMHYADQQEFIVGPRTDGRYYLIQESGPTTTLLAATLNLKGTTPTYAFKYEGAQYFFSGIQDTVPGAATKWWTFTDKNTPAGSGSAEWFIAQTNSGKTRHVLTFIPTVSVNDIRALGLVGYTDFSAFSSAIVPQPLTCSAAPTVTSYVLGYNYVDVSATVSGATVKGMAPALDGAAAWFSGPIESDTTTAINGYGRFFPVKDDSSTFCSFRSIIVNGVQSAISACVSGTTDLSSYDALGVPLTNVGEWYQFYVPHVRVTASKAQIIYKYGDQFIAIRISASPTRPIQRIDSRTYKINTISPNNVIDVTAKTLELGSNDYNGRMWYPAASTAGTSHLVAAKISGTYSNSIDIGQALTTRAIAGYSTSGSLYPFATLIPYTSQQRNIGSVDIYWDGVYLSTFYALRNVSFYRQGADPSKSGLLYVTDTRLPIALGSVFRERSAITDMETIFTGVGVIGQTDISFSYDGYEIGNQINGSTYSFTMLGQRYLFDGTWIWLSNFSGPIFSGRDKICPAKGVTFLAASPTEAYFLSTFDSSLYVFDGGRALVKQKRMNDIRTSANALEQITDGVYSVIDNTLLLQTASTFIWIRDGIVTQTYKKAAQTGITLYDTTAGLQIANNTQKWRYTFYALTGPASTVVPFTFQSAYFGVTQNLLGVVQAFIFAVQSSDKAATSFTVTIDGFDADGEWHEDIPFNLTPSDWSPLGLYRARVIPQHTMQIAVSVGFKTSSRLLLHSIVPEFTPDASATPAASRSK